MPKKVDVTERRQYYAGIAIRLIAREGLEALTLRRVAAEAGVTTGALTHYFADREALIALALDTVADSAGRRMQAALHREIGAAARLRAVLLESLPLDEERLAEWRVWLAFWGAGLADPALARHNAGRYAEWRGLLAMLVEVAGGPASDADHLLALIDGLGIQAVLASAAGMAPQDVQRRALDMIELYLKASEH